MQWLNQLFNVAKQYSFDIVLFIIFLKVTKKYIQQIISKYIDTLFEKKLEIYKNNILRSTKAYEFLLNKEFEFYEKINEIIGEIIPLIQDLDFYTKKNDNIKFENQLKNYQKSLSRYIELYITAKNILLTYQIYISKNFFEQFTKLIEKLQKYSEYWYQVELYLFNNNITTINYDEQSEIVNMLLTDIAMIEYSIVIYLNNISSNKKIYNN